MAKPHSKRTVSPALRQKINRLRLPLAPLVPMPSGAPHPDFPKTLLAYHLLTEDQLDRLAHHYHQSTPGVWTDQYPISVLWPRKGSSAGSTTTTTTTTTPATAVPAATPRLNVVRRASTGDPAWSVTTTLAGVDLPRNVVVAGEDDDPDDPKWLSVFLAAAAATGPKGQDESAAAGKERRWSAILLDDKQRIAIKRRKIGKFIGLVGMQTPAAEVESRMQHDMERTIRAGRRDRRRQEEEDLVRGKMR